jgi:hypothetical protein
VLNKQEQHGLKNLPASTATRRPSRVGPRRAVALHCESHVHVHVMYTKRHADR